jgi:hypothetical protein
VLLLGVGGLGALRHAAGAGTNSGYCSSLWAGGTLCTMLLVDRAESRDARAPLAVRARPRADPRAAKQAATRSS